MLRQLVKLSQLNRTPSFHRTRLHRVRMWCGRRTRYLTRWHTQNMLLTLCLSVCWVDSVTVCNQHDQSAQCVKGTTQLAKGNRVLREIVDSGLQVRRLILHIYSVAPLSNLWFTAAVWGHIRRKVFWHLWDWLCRPGAAHHTALWTLRAPSLIKSIHRLFTCFVGPYPKASSVSGAWWRRLKYRNLDFLLWFNTYDWRSHYI